MFTSNSAVVQYYHVIQSQQFQGWAGGSVSEHTPSESGATTEEESSAAVSSKPPPGPGPVPPLNKSNSQKYDYVEPVHSASSLSTPPNSSFSDDPFASESLGATAICLGKTMAKIKGEIAFSSGGGGEGEGEREGSGLKPPVISPGPLKTENEFVSEMHKLLRLFSCMCVRIDIYMCTVDNSIFILSLSDY